MRALGRHGNAPATLRFAVAGGALAALSQPTVAAIQPVAGALWILPGAAFLFLALNRAPSPRRAFFVGWLAGVVYFATTLHWMVYPFLVKAESHLWALPLAALVPAGLAGFWGAGCWTAHRLSTAGLSRAIAFAVFLSVAEWVRGVILTGFPWATPGYAWIDTPIRNLLSVGGIYALTLLSLLLPALAIVLADIRVLRDRRGWLRAIATAAIPAGVLALGWWATTLPGAPIPSDTGAGPTLHLVQPNIPQREKWRSEFRSRNLGRLVRLSQTGAGVPPDLVIWPEAAIPWLLSRDGPESVESFARDLPLTTALATGVLTRSASGEHYNSLALIDRSDTLAALYDKQHLVPFGEYLPLERLLRLLALEALAGGGYTAGAGATRFELPGIPPFAASICYEAIFPLETRRAARGASWILQITNDAWFGPDAGPRQHFAQARARAAELGLPLVRVANTGITALTDARGRIVDSLPPGVADTLTLRLPPAIAGGTLYARHGDLVFWLLILTGILWLGIERTRERRSGRSNRAR